MVAPIDMIDSWRKAPYLISLKEGQRLLRTVKEGLDISELNLEVGWLLQLIWLTALEKDCIYRFATSYLYLENKERSGFKRYPLKFHNRIRGYFLCKNHMRSRSGRSFSRSRDIARTKEGVALRGTPWNFTIGLGGNLFVKTKCDLDLGVPSQDHVILW